MAVDGAIERAGRWMAARQSRRSFLGRFGKAAVLVAAGPSLAAVLADSAEARVCGQSGVSPRCTNFDCLFADSVWGWCWYASDGCCRNGGLKKICDCCTQSWPNVHGYCPAGTNVRCIVESCGNDPRVQTTLLARVAHDGSSYAAAARRMRFPAATTAVLGDATSVLGGAVAAPVAGALAAPLMRVGRTGPTPAELAELRSLGVTRLVLVAPALVSLRDSLRDQGFEIDVVGSAGDLEHFAEQTASWIRGVNGVGRTVTVSTAGLSGEAIGAAAVFAAAQGFPVLPGPAVAERVGLPTLLVGPELAPHAGTLRVASEATSSRSLVPLLIELAELAYASAVVDRSRATLVPVGSDFLDVVDLGCPVVAHPSYTLGSALDWVFRHQTTYGSFGTVHLGVGPGAFGDPDLLALQSALNGFQVQELQGVSGDGLPVISQPLPEREIGRARVDGRPLYPSQTPPSYWTSRAQTLR